MRRLIQAEHLFPLYVQRAFAEVNAEEGKAAADGEIDPVETGSSVAVLSA